MKSYCILLSCFLPLWSLAQNITTIAGNGASTFSGENVLAILAQTPGCNSGAFDKYGNYYFCDGVNSNRIRRISPSGYIVTVAGNGLGGFSGDGGLATAARLNGPSGVAVDTLGNIYIADAQNHRIRKVDGNTGIISTYAGTGTGTFDLDGVPATNASLWGIQDICLDRFGNLYIADGFNYRIRKVNPSGIISTYAGNGTPGYAGEGVIATSSTIGLPVGICSDTAGNIYVCSNTICRVTKISTSGLMTTVAGNGGTTYIGDGLPATDAQIVPGRIFVDKAGNMFIADRNNNRLYKIDPVTNTLYNIAGNGVAGDSGDGAAATSATLFTPVGVTLDACGNIYVPTVGSVSVVGSGRRIRKITYSTTGIAGIGITVLPNDTVCAGTAVTYSATLTDSSTTGYQWYKNGAPITGATNSTYTYTPTETGDDIHCVYTGIDVCSIAGHPASNTIHMVVTPLAVPTISLGGSTAAPLGSTVTVTATVGGAGSSYSIDWYRNGLPLATTTVPTVTYTKTAGTDAITARLSSTDAVGCYDTTTSATHTVLVGPNGVNDVAPQAMAVTISPNPARTVLHIDGAVHTWRIMGVTGAVLLQGGPLAGHTIMVQDLPAGMYYIELCHPTGQRTLHRFVKE
jgi:sugar lactone lactonase YvrE